MRSRRFSIWQKMVAFAPLLLLVMSLPGQSLLRCRIDGLLRSSCCCPAADEPVNSVPVVKAQDCCDREAAANERPVVEPARTSAANTTGAVSAGVSVPFVGLAFADPNRSERVWQAQAPPRRGLSIVLLKQAFLI